MSSLISRVSNALSLRSNPFNNPNYPMTEMNVNAFLSEFGGQHRSDSGEVVNHHTAMYTSTVLSCVKIISEKIATTPLFMYQLDSKGNKELAIDHDYFDLVTNRPNPEQDATQFRTAVQTSVLLWGNAYIELQRDNGNRVASMWHRHPSRTEPVRMKDGTLMYRTTDSVDREARFIKPDDMIPIMGVTFDGYIGLSPIMYAKQYIGANLAMDKFGARFFANNAMPQIALITKQQVKAEDKTKMRQDWESLQSGRNQHRVAILDGDMSMEKLSISQDEAQFLQSRMLAKRDIASIFSVPGHMVGDVEKGVKANVEQQAQDFLSTCLEPWMSKWEKAFTCKLFSQRGRSVGRYVVNFDKRVLLMPDSASKISFYQMGIQNGIISPNEARTFEGLNSIGPAGDAHFIQLNMQTLENASIVAPSTTPPDLELVNEEEANSLPRNLGQNYRGLFKDGVQRLMKSNRDHKAVYRCLWPTLDALSKAASSGVGATSHEECDKAVDKLIEGIEHRAKKWADESIETICADEILRVAKSLIFAAHADVANAKARKVIAELENEQEETDDEQAIEAARLKLRRTIAKQEAERTAHAKGSR